MGIAYTDLSKLQHEWMVQGHNREGLRSHPERKAPIHKEGSVASVDSQSTMVVLVTGSMEAGFYTDSVEDTSEVTKQWKVQVTIVRM